MPHTSFLESITLPFFYVFTQFAAGGLFVCTLVPEKEAGRNFFRLTGGALFCFAGMALWILGKLLHAEPELGIRSSMFFLKQLLVFFLAVLALYNLFLWLSKEKLHRFFLYLGSLTGSYVVAQCAYTAATSPGFTANIYPGMVVISFLLSSLLLGSAGVGMLFGHWYLVSPRLPLEPLERMTKLYLVCVLLVGIFMAVTVFGPWAGSNTLMERYTLYFWWRVIFGILASLVVAVAAVLSLRPGAEKYSRTRAATGLLYIAVLTVFTGELLGRFLFVVTKVPV